MAWRQLSFFILAPLLFTANARAQDKEPAAIVELGAAGEWGLPGISSYGPSVAVEFTPIKDWLEIEVGAARMFHGGRSEWDTDLLFKKPFTLSETGVHGRHRTTMDVLPGRHPDWRGVRSRLHVLANRGPKVWLVSGASLQLLFQQRS